MSVVTIALFREHQSLKPSKHSSVSIRWALPQRYVSESEVATISEMLEKFMNYCRLYPTIVALPHEMKYHEIFLRLLPRVEEVYIFTCDSSCALVMAGVLQNSKGSRETSVSLAGYRNTFFSVPMHGMIILFGSMSLPS